MLWPLFILLCLTNVYVGGFYCSKHYISTRPIYQYKSISVPPPVTISGSSLSNQLSIQPRFTGDDLSSILFSIKSTYSNNGLVYSKLKHVLRMLDNSNVSSPMSLSSYHLGKCFIGIQNLDADKSTEMRQLLNFLATLIATSTQERLEVRTIANIILGLKTSSHSSVEVQRVIKAVNFRIQKDPDILLHMDEQRLSTILRGLKCMSSTNRQVVELLHHICNSLDVIKEGGRFLRFKSGEELASAFIGLSEMSIDEPAVQRLIIHLSAMMHWSNDTTMTEIVNNESSYTCGTSKALLTSIEERHIATCLYGLRSFTLSNDNPNNSDRDLNIVNNYRKSQRALEAILRAISALLNQWNGRLSPNSIGNALYGLQGIGARSIGVRQVLRGLMRCMDRESVEYTGQLIAMSLYGLKTLGKPVLIAQKSTNNVEEEWMCSGNYLNEGFALSTVNEVKKLINILAESVLKSNHRMSPSELSRALFGLQHISADSPAVRRIINELANKFLLSPLNQDQNKTNHLTGQEIAMMMKGLSSMGSEWIQIRTMLAVCTKLISDSPARMRAAEVAMALNSLHTKGGGQWTLPPTSNPRKVIPTPNVIADITDKDFEVLTENSTTDEYKEILFPTDFHKLVNQSPRSSRRKYKPPRELLGLLDALADKMENRIERLNCNYVGTALFGLQGLSHESAPIKRLLKLLAEDLQFSNKMSASMSTSSAHTPGQSEPQTNSTLVNVVGLRQEDIYMDSRSMSNAVFGLQNMTSKSIHVRRLLHLLAEAIDLSPHHFTAQGIGNSFYGLQSMSCEKPEVRRLLQALTSKAWSMPWSISDLKQTEKQSNMKNPGSISGSFIITVDDFKETYNLSGQNIGNALWGLRNMTSDHPEVREALRVLALRILQSDAQMSGQNLGNAFFSLQSMPNFDSNGEAVPVVIHIVTALAHKLVASKASFSSLDVGMSLYGLRSMQSDSPEVRAVLGALIVKMKESSSQMHLRELMIAVMGLLRTPPELRDHFLELLADKSGMSYVG